MYQIDVSTAATQLPAASQPGTPGYFTDGDLPGGVAPTIVPAEFLNAVMVEMLNVLAGAGVAPAKGANNQLLAAINVIAFKAAVPRYVNAAMAAGQALTAGAYDVDTSAGSFTLLLPAVPQVGTIVRIRDITGTWEINPLTVARNGSTIVGNATDLVCNIGGEEFEIWFNGSTWKID